MRALLPLLLVALAACYSPRTVGGGAQPTGPYGELYQEPLRASLWMDPNGSFASFDLNRPAHVAIFEWQPGGHLEMIQPAIGSRTQRFFAAGRHSTWARTDQQLASRSRSFAQFAGGFHSVANFRAGPGPIYYMLIASTEPLHVAPFGVARMNWAHRVNWTNNPYTATELLATQIVPDYENTEWTVAYHVGWIDDHAMRAPPERAYVWINCPGGLVIAVPLAMWDAGQVACPALPGDPEHPEDPDDPEGEDAARDGTRPERVPTRPDLPGTTPADEATDAEFQRLRREIQEARGIRVTESASRPVPAWRAPARRAQEAAPAVRSLRPTIRPAAAERTHRDAWPTPTRAPVGARAQPGSGGRGEPATPTRGGVVRGEGVDRTPRANPGSTVDRSTPRPDHSTPTVDRSTPAGGAPTPTPRSERPARPPDGDG